MVELCVFITQCLYLKKYEAENLIFFKIINYIDMLANAKFIRLNAKFGELCGQARLYHFKYL